MKTELTISLEDFKLVKKFYPEFSKKEGIKTNECVIGWSEIMPVVEKINNVITDKQKEFPAYLDLDDPKGWRAWSYRAIPHIQPIGIIYQKAIDFIKWYNTQHP
jgi:hypothetical protein